MLEVDSDSGATAKQDRLFKAILFADIILTGNRSMATWRATGW
jgi:hypothetical protein